MQVGNLTVEKTAVSEQARVKVDWVTVTGIDALLYRPADGAWELDRWLDSDTDTGEPKPDPQARAGDNAVAEGAAPGDDAELDFVLGAGYIRESNDYLVQQGIADKRFVLCNPTLGEPDVARPRTVTSF